MATPAPQFSFQVLSSTFVVCVECIVYQMDNGRMLFRMLDHLLLDFLKNIIYGEHIISIILVFLCGIVFSRSEHYNFEFVYNTRIVPQGICLPKHAKKIGAEARASGWNRTVSLSQLYSLLLNLSFPESKQLLAGTDVVFLKPRMPPFFTMVYGMKRDLLVGEMIGNLEGAWNRKRKSDFH